MNRRLAVIVLLLAAGCGGDPENDILKPGQLVTVAKPEGIRLGNTDDQSIFPLVAPGVQLRVGYDPGHINNPEFEFDSTKPGTYDEQKATYDNAEHERVSPPNGAAKYRKIKITVQDGPRSGVSGEVTRKDVRAAP